MPEGPEVKRVAQNLEEKLCNFSLGDLWHSGYKLRRSLNYDALKNCSHKIIKKVDCYGKILFAHDVNGVILKASLGMTGQLVVVKKNLQLAAHTHIRWQVNNSDYELRYVDIRRFGMIEACDNKNYQQTISKLGPDPFILNNESTLILKNKILRSKKSIKEVLMDQSIVVGVGNIYASEALFKAKINPLIPACSLSLDKITLLISTIKNTLEQALSKGGTTFSNYVDGNNSKGGNQDYLLVFKKENQPCSVCGNVISRIKQAGRSTFFCSSCQY